MRELDPEARHLRQLILEEEKAEKQAAKAERDSAARQQRAREEASAAELLRKRDEAPPGYVAPGSAAEVIARVSQGERHFAGAKLRGGNFKSLKLAHASFANAYFSQALIEDCQFVDCDFTSANFVSARFRNVQFVRCVMAGVSFHETNLAAVRMEGVSLKLVDFADAIFEGFNCTNCSDLPSSFGSAKNPGSARFSDCAFTGAVLRDTRLGGIEFKTCILASVDFTNADLRGADLTGSTLTNSMLEGTLLSGVRAESARFAGSSLRLAKDLREISWRGLVISECDLSDSELQGLDFSNVIARNTNFSESRLQNCKFKDADVSGALFKGAKLGFTDWSGAELNSADFEGADLRYVKTIRFDLNNLYTARLSPKGADIWTELRRQYSGSRLAFHLLILVAFFLPYVIRAAAWVQVNNAQTAHAAALAAMQADPEKRKILEAARRKMVKR